MHIAILLCYVHLYKARASLKQHRSFTARYINDCPELSTTALVKLMSTHMTIRSGRVRKWLTAKTRRNGYIGQLGIVCSEESVVPALPVTYGFNGTNADTCDIDLLEQKFTQNPEDNIFYYR